MSDQTADYRGWITHPLLCVALFAGSLTLAPCTCAAGQTTFSGELRLRGEALDSAFHAARKGSDQLLTSRLTVRARRSFGSVRLEGELSDSRGWLDDAGTPIGTDDINTLEPLQAFIGWQPVDGVDLRVGRMTRDLGSRRHLGRQRFRNTFNAFTGIDLAWQAKPWTLTAFWYHPVERRPTSRQDLDDHAVRLDRSHRGYRFLGVHLGHTNQRRRVELTALGLREDDSAFPTRNRKLTTLGLRALRTPEPSTWDYEIEFAAQTGSLRSSTAVDARKLDHRAGFAHAQLGYMFADSWQTRVTLQANISEGDRDPLDPDSERYDGNFGVRVFDYGATGIYGAFSRSNTTSMRLRLLARPSPGTRLQMALGHFRLASATDRHATSGVRDPSGDSGKTLGWQFDWRLQHTFTQRWSVAAGGALLEPGKFLRTGPNRTHTAGNTRYFYAETTLSL